MTPPEHTGSRRLDALSELARGAVERPSPAALQHGLIRLRARMQHARSRKPVARWWALSLAVALSGTLWWAQSAFFTNDANSEPPVAVHRVEGGQILDGGYLSEVGGSGIKLVFNEGSTFALASGARGRLSVAPREGARLALERGSASVQITKNPEHRWSIEAGPFVVVVRGTDFGVDWDPTHEELEVRLRRGRVAVSGPIVGEELVLRAGQTLTVNLPERRSLIQETRSLPEKLAPEGAASAPPAGGVPVASGEPKPPSSPAASPVPSAGAVSERSWREAIATGDWDRVLAEVDRAGVTTTLRTLSSEDLFAVADAARYRRRMPLARAALLEQLRRFPSAPRSLDALFLLGRVEEGGDASLAIQRYDEYLRRAPAGTYAAEALGRRMILTQRVEGPASAGRVAEQYLRRFPSGSYAKAARTLQRSAPQGP